MRREDILLAAELLKEPTNRPEYGKTRDLTENIRCLSTGPDAKTEKGLIQANYDGQGSDILMTEQNGIVTLCFSKANRYWLQDQYFSIWNI